MTLQDIVPSTGRIKVFQKDDKILAYNPTVPSWLVVNANSAIALSLCDGRRSIGDIAALISRQAGRDMTAQVRSFFDAAAKARLFDAVTTMPHHKPYDLGSVHFSMSESCNLNCRYCYASARVESEGRLGYGDYLRLVDEVIALASKKRITFTGGEPLLSPHTLPVARYAKGRGVTTILLTNGLLVGDDSACEIAQTFDQVSISLDGSTAEMHEYFRGEGTFEPTVRAIDALIGKGVDVQVTVTLNRRNQNEIAALGRRFGGRVKYAPLYPAGNALKNRDLEISGGEYYDALRRGAVANAFCHLENIVRAHQECRTIMKCGLGDGTLSISCSGDVYPCQLLHFPEFLVGNVMRQHLEEIYRSPKMRGFQCHTVNDMEGCRDCDLKLLCGGACQARHFYETGSLDKCGGFCEYEKRGIFNGILENHAFA